MRRFFSELTEAEKALLGAKFSKKLRGSLLNGVYAVVNLPEDERRRSARNRALAAEWRPRRHPSGRGDRHHPPRPGQDPRGRRALRRAHPAHPGSRRRGRGGMRVFAFSALLAASAAAFAQTYPSKPIRLIVPFPPGGSADILARAIGQKAGEGLGQPFVVENRPGAGTAIGADALAKSAPDGYAVMIGTVSSHAINPALNPKLPFDPLKDFTPVSLVATIPFAMIVHPSVPAKNVQEFIALAKAKPGSLNYSSAGNGTSNHLAGELLKSMARVDIVHVPYKGSAPALNDLIAGQVSLMFDLVLTAAPHVKSGAVRGLAVTGAQRSSALPELPTVAESGVPGYEVSAWFGIFAPAGLAQSVVQRLNAEFVKGLQQPDLRQRLASQGAEPLTSTPDEFGSYLRSEIAKWAKVVKESGMKVD